MKRNSGISTAVLAAVLFGASTPLAKLMLGNAAPVLVAGLLYLGSGVGLSIWLLLRRLRPDAEPATPIARTDVPWLAAAVIAGGIAAPVLLMTGLAQTPASSASLLLNMEGVLTAAFAWFVFHEQFDRRIFTGMLLIIAAGVLLAWSLETSVEGLANGAGPLLIVAACFCWAVDNNLTRKISANDAVLIAAIKGMAAATVNLSVAAWLGVPWPPLPSIALTLLVGLAGYGISLVMFVLSLRALGTARTGAWFSVAPFAGAALSLLLFREIPGALFWIAALLMAIGLWLHLTEAHVHLHQHEVLDHTHPHSHDDHHQHVHDFPWDGKEPHMHAHHHVPLMHKHPHYPDLHHRHRH